jgi:hypothetical protein
MNFQGEIFFTQNWWCTVFQMNFQGKNFFTQNWCNINFKQIIYDNNFGYEKITILGDNMPLSWGHLKVVI